LIDAPLAGLVLVFSAMLGPELAEDAARAAWPLLLLLPLLLSITAISGCIGGRRAALCAPLLSALCIGGLVLFRPGYIHHHNAQMTLAALFVWLSFTAPRSRAAAIGAGVVAVVTLAVGLESLAVLGVAAAGYTIRFAMDPQEGRNFVSFALSCAVSAAIIFAAAIPQNLWLTTQCDSYAVNMLSGIVVGGLGAGIVGRFGARLSTPKRFSGLALAGAAALAAYVIADPSCLKGPFGHLDPEIWQLWLSQVAEMRSVPSFVVDEPARAVIYLAFPPLGLAALALLWRTNRRPESLVLGSILIVATVIAAMHIRGLIYANWFAVPVLAAAAGLLRPETRPKTSPERSLRLRLQTVMLAGLLVVASGAAFLSRRGPDTGSTASQAEEAALGCSRVADYAELARLPPGRVLPHVDLGPYILATTDDSVLVAPYHRLQRELIFGRRLLAGDAASAEEELRQAGVDYLVDCRGEADAIEDAPGSLRRALMSGHPPAFLEPVRAAAGSPLLIWRLRHN
jgi:hypothetical protein